MKSNLIIELWEQGRITELVASKDYLDGLEGEDKVNTELMWAYCVLEQNNDSETYQKVIEKYQKQELPARSLLNVKLHQAAYLGWLKAKYDEALVVLDQCDSIYQELFEKDKYDLLYLRAWYFHLKGTYHVSSDIELGIKLLNQGLAVFDNNPEYTYGLLLKSALLSHLGILFSQKGEYEIAEDKFNRSIDFAKLLGNESFQSIPLSNLSLIYSYRGEISKAMETLETGFTIAQEYGTSRTIAELLGFKGGLLVQLKEYNSALDCFREALIQAKKLNLVSFESRILYHMIMVLYILRLDNWEDEVSRNLQDLEKLVKSSSSKNVLHLHLLSQALHLKNHPRLIQKLKAQEILQKIIDDDPVDFYIQMQAMLYQCDLLLVELKASDNEELLNEISHLLDRLTSLAEGKFIATIEILILKATMAMIKGNREQAFKYLDEGYSIAYKMDLKHYIQKIIDTRKKIDQQIKIWSQLTEINSPLGEIVKQLEIQDYLNEAIELTTLHSKE